MKTIVLNGEDKNDIETAAKAIASGDVVAIPTETVYGLGANALSENAVNEIFNVKGRPADNPLIVHIADIEDAKKLWVDIPKNAYKLAGKFWPGPLTIICKKSDSVPLVTSGGLDSIGVRIPADKIALSIIEKSGCAIAAPSANISGRPSPTRVVDVIDDLNNKVPFIVDGGDCDIGVESTVLTLLTDPPRILRPGRVTKEEIEEVIGEVIVDRAVVKKPKEGEIVRSPGVLYKHYSPKTPLIAISGSDERFIEFINRQSEDIAAICFTSDIEKLNCKTIDLGDKSDNFEIAKRLYTSLRTLDELCVLKGYIRISNDEGIGLAIKNRLLRAVSFEVIYV